MTAITEKTVKETTPKIKDIKLTTIFGEEIDAKIIPLSIKASMDVDDTIEILRAKLQDKRTDRIERAILSVSAENQDDEELKTAYIEGLITIELSRLGQEITDKRVKAQAVKRRDKLLEGMSIDDIIKGLAKIAVDLEERKEILYITVGMTLYNVLRKVDNLREYVFDSVDDLQESLDQDMLFTVFNKKVDENKIEEEDLKN